jgi:hypothetical protein
MSKRDRKLVQEAEAQLIAYNQLISNLFDGLCDKSSSHPNFTDPDYRWVKDGFAVLKNENEETPKLLKNCPVSIYSQNAFELSVALHFITQDAVEKLLKRRDREAFFLKVAEILRSAPEKYEAMTHEFIFVDRWEIIALRDIVSYALSWVGEAPSTPRIDSFKPVKKEASKNALDIKYETQIRKSGAEIYDSGSFNPFDNFDYDQIFKNRESGAGPRNKSIAGIPGLLFLEVWYPLLNPSIIVKPSTLKTVTRYLTRHNLNPTVAMGALMNQMILQGNSLPPNPPLI